MAAARLCLTALAAAAALVACGPKTDAPAEAVAEAKVPLNCKPADGIFGFLSQVGVYDVWDDRPIRPLTIANFEALDGKGMPLKMIYRFEGQDTVMPVAHDGSLTFASNAIDPSGGELCLLDPARVGDEPGGLNLSLNAEFVIKYDAQGYTVDVLERSSLLSTEYIARVISLNTGRNIDGVLGKADWITIDRPQSAPVSWTVPEHKLMRGNESVPYGDTDSGDAFFSFSLEDAKEAGVDRLVISGQDYKLSAMFNPNTVPENYKELLGVK